MLLGFLALNPKHDSDKIAFKEIIFGAMCDCVLLIKLSH